MPFFLVLEYVILFYCERSELRIYSASILAACPLLLRFGSMTIIHNSHEYMRARPRNTLDVNFEISNYFSAVELLTASEASF